MHVGADNNMTSKRKGKGVELAETSGKCVACGDSILINLNSKFVSFRLNQDYIEMCFDRDTRSLLSTILL